MGWLVWCGWCGVVWLVWCGVVGMVWLDGCLVWLISFEWLFSLVWLVVWCGLVGWCGWCGLVWCSWCGWYGCLVMFDDAWWDCLVTTGRSSVTMNRKSCFHVGSPSQLCCSQPFSTSTHKASSPPKQRASIPLPLHSLLTSSAAVSSSSSTTSNPSAKPLRACNWTKCPTT